jgi:hypothetical protein
MYWASYTATLKHLSLWVGADIQRSAQVEHLLAVLNKLEIARNKILFLRFAFERKRLRQKLRGRRTPATSDVHRLHQAVADVMRSDGLIPPLDPPK